SDTHILAFWMTQLVINALINTYHIPLVVFVFSAASDVYKGYNRDLHRVVRRQRQMCIRDRFFSVLYKQFIFVDYDSLFFVDNSHVFLLESGESILPMY
ncbi:hypothetical protein B9N22_20015, partial [Escherichia coli]|uniref:hypothetical protein n=1 Tax=Escherichia coli TaxID=562 RepID=UPI000E01B736